MGKKILVILFILPVVVFFVTHVILAQMQKRGQFWQITSVDSVKYSRDRARDRATRNKIPQIVEEASKLNITHLAIDTPYDDEFYPVLKAWVTETRKHNIHVWFRGNFSGWEGWFGYQQFSSIDQHNSFTKAFVLKHPDLFEDGDIFTPLPEPENGGPGDPRGSDDKKVAFNNMLTSSYDNCTSVFEQIHKQVSCGFFSTNGDIAKDILTPQTIAHIGNVIVIDHYVDSPDGMQQEINSLVQKFPQAKIVLGEFGAPIPDINGDMTQQQQESFIYSLLQVFYTNRAHIIGLNYWTLIDGSTALLNEDLSERKVFDTLASYYGPPTVSGRIVDTIGNGLGGVEIKDKAGVSLAISNSHGYFSFGMFPNTIQTIYIVGSGYKPYSQSVIVPSRNKTLPDIKLKPTSTSIFYKIRLFIRNLLSL